MTDVALCYGIPNISLPRIGGGTINPCHFAGHELVVFFCPRESAAAAAEVEAYHSRSTDFADGGAWLIGIVGTSFPETEPGTAGEAKIALARDAEGAAWAAFEGLLDASERSEPANGAAFFFARGGSLAGTWAGPAHADDVLKALDTGRPESTAVIHTPSTRT